MATSPWKDKLLQLDAKVLLSPLEEPRSPAFSARGVPKLSKSALGKAGACLAGVQTGSLSAREARGRLPGQLLVDKAGGDLRGLARSCYKDDHQHTVVALEKDVFRTTLLDPAVDLVALASDDAKPKLAPAPPATLSPRRGPKGRGPSRARSVSDGDALEKASQRSDDPERLARLQECFKLDPQEIETEVLRLWAVQAKSLKRDLSEDSMHAAVRKVFDSFENARFTAAPVRLAELPGDEERMKASPENPGAVHHHVVSASAAEVACCIDMLNFVRRLCGLQTVKANPVRLKLCDILSQSLLPREMGFPPGRFGGKPAEFADAIRQLTRCCDGFSIMHCEVSLVAAIETALGANNSVTPQALRAHASPEPTSLIKALHERMGPASIEIKRRAKSEQIGVINSKQSAVARQNVVDRRAAAALFRKLPANVLPPAVAPLGIYWDMVNSYAGQTNAEATTTRPPQGPPQRPPRHKLVADGAGIRQNINQTVHRGGLTPEWNNRCGAITVRCALLNPRLRRFGAARRQDTCVLWTGSSELSDEESDDKAMARRDSTLRKGSKATARRNSNASGRRNSTRASDTPHVEAVSFPPPGIVPAFLLQDGVSPWTIMADSALFSPTASTTVEAWRVRICRPGEGNTVNWSVERLEQVAVRGSSVGYGDERAPFCVSFWPDLGRRITHGDQLEVRLSGLRGRRSELTFFYDVRHIHLAVLDGHFLSASTKWHRMLADGQLWDKPRVPPASTDAPAAAVVAVAAGRRIGPQQARRAKLPTILTVSHHSLDFTSHENDINLTIKSAEIECLQAELQHIKILGDCEVVPRATQVMRLYDAHYLIRVKLPIPRLRYRLRFFYSLSNSECTFIEHPLQYTITAGERCHLFFPTSSLQDRLLPLFGLAQTFAATQRYGVHLVAPSSHRVEVGPCYFLIHVDKVRALAAAAMLDADESVLDSQVEQASPDNSGRGPSTTLFSARLLPGSTPSSTRRRRDIGSEVADENKCEIQSLFERLRGSLEHRCQDSPGQLHLFISFRNGDRTYRLYERDDFDGFYQGVYDLGDADTDSEVTVSISFPQAHAALHAPMMVARWFTSKKEHLPYMF